MAPSTQRIRNTQGRIQLYLGLVVLGLVLSFYYCSHPNLPTTPQPSLRTHFFQQQQQRQQHNNQQQQQRPKCPHVKPYSSLLLEEQDLVNKVMEGHDLGCQNVVYGGLHKSGACKRRRNGIVCVHPHGVVKQGERIGEKLGAHHWSVSPVHHSH